MLIIIIKKKHAIEMFGRKKFESNNLKENREITARKNQFFYIRIL